MATQHTSGSGTSEHEAQPGTHRTTGKLLATQGYVLGAEISAGGKRQSVALADLNGTILHRVHRQLDSTPERETALELLDEMLTEITVPEKLRDGRIVRIGVAVDGLVDTTSGIVRTLHDAHGWDNFPLQDYLAENLDLPCIIDNNANAAALAEVQSGAACAALSESSPRRAERIALYIGLGRNIAGGLVINGKIYHGISYTAGEIGHLRVKENGPLCSCGGAGHLEAIVSSQAITRTLVDLASEYPETTAAIQRLTNAEAERITPQQVFQLADQGDIIAARIVQDVQTYLGIALANIVYLINPGMIILGGQVALAGDALIAPLQASINALYQPVVGHSTRVVQSKHGSEANIVGAVTLALQEL